MPTDEPPRAEEPELKATVHHLRRDPRAHREVAITRLLRRGLSPTVLIRLLPEWTALIQVVASTTDGTEPRRRAPDE